MKNFKFVAGLTALLLCCSMLLTACGGGKEEPEDTKDTVDTSDTINKDDADSEADNEENEKVTQKISDIMNKKWTLNKTSVINKFEEVNFLGSYSAPENGFLISTDTSQNRKTITYVYNTAKSKLLVTLNDNYETKSEGSGIRPTTVYSYVNNYVDVIADGYFAVLTVTRSNTNSSVRAAYTSTNFGAMYDFGDVETKVFANYKLVIYNAEGTAVKTIESADFAKNCNGEIDNFDRATSGWYYSTIKEYQPEKAPGTAVLDLRVDGSKVYRLDENSKYALVKDFGILKMPDFTVLTKMCDKYVEKNGYSVIVYDSSLNEEFKYDYPAYADGVKYFILADGSLFIQYAIELDTKSESFDYRVTGSEKKYDLVTMRVNKDGATSLENVDYKLISLETSYTELNGQKVYGDKIENVAIITFIGEDKLVDESESNYKLVSLSNDCKSMVEVVINGAVVNNFPRPINDDLFGVDVSGGGKAIFNDNGEKQSIIENIQSKDLLAGKYIVVKDDAVYDLKGSKIYDLKANNANYIQIGDSLIIISGVNSDNIKYSLFKDGALTDITGKVIDASSDGYYIVETEVKSEESITYKYSYFNSNGEAIGIFDGKLQKSFDGNGFMIMKLNVNDGKTYKFIYNA